MELIDGELDRMYVYGVTGMIAALDAEENTYFVPKDHLGSTRSIINSSNEVVSHYCYDPFGETIESEVSFDIRYKYTGQEFDWETGLHNYRARMYDSFNKRFPVTAYPRDYRGEDGNAVDPLLQFPSPYCYVGNNPVSFIDPTGEYIEWLYMGWQLWKLYSYYITVHEATENLTGQAQADSLISWTTMDTTTYNGAAAPFHNLRDQVPQ